MYVNYWKLCSQNYIPNGFGLKMLSRGIWYMQSVLYVRWIYGKYSPRLCVLCLFCMSVCVINKREKIKKRKTL